MTNVGLPTVQPMVAVQVHSLAVGVSARASRPGYVPATPVADPAAASQLWVVWLGPEALIAMDATEPNYRRVRLPPAIPYIWRRAQSCRIAAFTCPGTAT
jgi:hypothetical protein